MIIVSKDNDRVSFTGTPNTWRQLKSQDGSASASYTCPNGHSGILTDHEIDIDGTVNPSVVCPESGCNFHDYIQLDEWDDGLSLFREHIVN